MRFSGAIQVCLFLGLVGNAVAAAPEPQGFWTGAMLGETPATLAGGRLIHTQALADLLTRDAVVLIDVAEPPHRPENLAPDAIWKPLAHRNLFGSVWIPGAGAGRLDDDLNAFFRDRLAMLTGDDLDRPVVFYCHPNCWASWNAAKRAISLGYRNVYWYADGVEGWQDGGLPLAPAQPEAPQRDR
jgi:PQQ-dependent catabolism-associated CXXCW motif protein